MLRCAVSETCSGSEAAERPATHILHSNDTRRRHQRVREGGLACPRDTLSPRDYDWTVRTRAYVGSRRRSLQRTAATAMLLAHCSAQALLTVVHVGDNGHIPDVGLQESMKHLSDLTPCLHEQDRPSKHACNQYLHMMLEQHSVSRRSASFSQAPTCLSISSARRRVSN